MTVDDPRREHHPDSPPLAGPATGAGAGAGSPRNEWTVAWPDSAEHRPELDSEDEDEGDDGKGADREPIALVIRDRRRHLGIVAFVLAGLLFAANVVGIVLSNSGSDDAALSIAYVTIFGTIVTFAGGLLAAALDFGRGWGVAAVVLSVLANPFVLVVLLGSFTGALG